MAEAVVKVYVGQARGHSLIARLTALGFGEMTVREEFPPRRHPWAFDNGAFKDFKASRPFDEVAFIDAVRKIKGQTDRPDFVVCPDIVMGGESSLAFSMRWALSPVFADLGAPLFLAVQDGMTEAPVEKVLPLFGGLFIGGSLPWKIKTGARWAAFAHERNVRCHVGRVGTFKRTRWALRIGADSIDSCLPLWSEENLRAFLAALAPNPQREMVL